MGKATFVRQLGPSANFRGDARLFKLDPPLPYKEWMSEPKQRLAEYVIVSAVEVGGEPETYIFPADTEGQVLDWAELAGSFQGDLDHTRALKGAGYDIEGKEGD